jgi:hypothetical protein
MLYIKYISLLFAGGFIIPFYNNRIQQSPGANRCVSEKASLITTTCKPAVSYFSVFNEVIGALCPALKN